jgi:apolipoprotein N-acyltransferase
MPQAPRNRLKQWLPDRLTILSGILIVASFPPWDIYPLIWISLIPWFFALRKRETILQAIIQGVWLSFLMSMGGFYWVGWVLHEFAEVPWVVAIAALLIWSFFGQLQFWIFAPFFSRFSRLSLDRPRKALAVLSVTLAMGFFYTGIDWFLPKLFMDTLGHSFYKATWLRQGADIGGAFLLTLLIFIVNEALFGLIARLKQREEPSIWPAVRASIGSLALALAFFLVAVLYGRAREHQVQAVTERARRTVQGAVIQANVGDFDKIASERGLKGASETVLRLYFQLSDQALALPQKPEFLIWPETAYPSTFRSPTTPDDLAHDQSVESYVKSRSVPLLFGGYDRANEHDYNTLFLLSPFAPMAGPVSDLQVYHKSILLLFGEYIPFADTFPILKSMFPQVGNFGRGRGPDVLSIPLPGNRRVLAGPVICYEALFSDFVIGAARKGAQFILNITNDSWFGPYGEPALHLSLTTFRSIETRLPQLRATNTGISTLIMPDGEITHATQVMTQEILNLSVPVVDNIPTLMKSWGDWFGKWALAAGIILLFLSAWLLRTQRS